MGMFHTRVLTVEQRKLRGGPWRCLTLWRDPKLLERSGKVLVAATVASELGVQDMNGKQPLPLTLETA